MYQLSRNKPLRKSLRKFKYALNVVARGLCAIMNVLKLYAWTAALWCNKKSPIEDQNGELLMMSRDQSEQELEHL
jgi:hypothetical protein